MTDPRTIVVTGASSGIGRRITEYQLEVGWRVIGLARNFSDFEHADERFVPSPIDLADLSAMPDKLTSLARHHPEVTGVICSAGAGRFGSLEEFSYANIRTLIDVNLTSQMYVIRAFLPTLKRNGRGDIVIIGSEAALLGGARGAVYSASKFALRGFAQSLRAECASSGVRVTIVNPGMVRTNFFKTLDFEHGPDPANFIEADDVAGVIASVLETRPETVFDEINLSPLKKVIKKKTPCK